MIHGIKITPKKQISDERGKIMHMLRNDDHLFNKWFWNQSLMYQYIITVLFIVRKIGMKTFPYVDLSLKNILELFKRENFFEFVSLRCATHYKITPFH